MKGKAVKSVKVSVTEMQCSATAVTHTHSCLPLHWQRIDTAAEGACLVMDDNIIDLWIFLTSPCLFLKTSLPQIAFLYCLRVYCHIFYTTMLSVIKLLLIVMRKLMFGHQSLRKV